MRLSVGIGYPLGYFPQSSACKAETCAWLGAREALGLRRRELYAHDDDWPKLQELAAKLQRKRAARESAPKPPNTRVCT